MPKSKRPGYHERWFITQMELYPPPKKEKPKLKEEEDNLLLIIIAGSGGAVVIIGVIILIYCCCCGKKQSKTTKVKKECQKKSKKVNPESAEKGGPDIDDDPALQFVINAKSKPMRQSEILRMETMWQNKDHTYKRDGMEIDTLLVQPQ